MTDQEAESLESFADRLTEDSDFMAFILATYGKHEKLNDQDLAIKLGLSREALIQLKLCRRPAQGSTDEIQRIAEFCGGDAAIIASIINQVDFLSSGRNRRLASNPQDLALAARKRTHPPPSKNP